MKRIYLACPYTHPEEQVRNERERMASWATAELLNNHPDVAIFSPITHGHRIADYLSPELRNDSGFWMKQCLPFLRSCDLFLVLTLEGWDKSEGINTEWEAAKKIHIPIDYLKPSALENKTYELN